MTINFIYCSNLSTNFQFDALHPSLMRLLWLLWHQLLANPQPSLNICHTSLHCICSWEHKKKNYEWQSYTDLHIISCSFKLQIWLRDGQNTQPPTATWPEMQSIQLCWHSTKYRPWKDKRWDKNSWSKFSSSVVAKWLPRYSHSSGLT